MAEILKPLVGFIGPSNTQRSERFDDQRTINLYLEEDPIGDAKNGQSMVLLSTPGLRLAYSFTGGVIRGLYTDSLGINTYVVCGSKIYYTNNQFTTVNLIGNLSTNVGPISFADNGSAVTDPAVMLVDGQFGYTLRINDPVDTFSVIISANFYPADTITFQDGYFILNNSGTGYFFLSNLNDITFGALNEALKSGYGDIIVAVNSNNRELYLFGTRTLEFWWDAGQSGVTPFQRIDGKFSNTGCSAAATVKKLGDTLFWVGPNEQGNGIVYGLSGDSPTRISNHAVELSLQSVDLAKTTAYAYQDEGHYFYCINNPNLNTTWVYDISTKSWAERQSYIDTTLSRHLGENYTFHWGNQYVGSYYDGNVYIYDHSYYLDNGQQILRLRQSPHVAAEVYNQFVTLFQIDAQFGVGLVSGLPNEIDPMLTLEVSKDGGETWGPPRQGTLGKIGKYKTRARWNRCGRSRDFVFRVTCTDPVNVSLLSAFLTIENGFA